LRALLEVIQFEIRYQLRSPFFLGALLMFALIHFLTITGTVIHIDISNQVAINSAYAILQIEQLLHLRHAAHRGLVTTAITRDFERATASLVFVRRSPRTLCWEISWGAEPGAFDRSRGTAGRDDRHFMPWLDQARIPSFSLLPWAYIFLVVILPSTLVLCAIFFSVAALTRSVALTWAAAMAFLVANVLLNLYAQLENGAWPALADPSARLTVAAETRYWTVAELNTNIPLGLLPQNRLLWLTVALLALLLALLRFRLDLAEQGPFRFKRRGNE
jgi:hypothetical protein